MGVGNKETILITRLEELRTKKGITVQALAEKSGVGRSTIYLYEQGNKRISIKSTWKILDALGIDNFINLNELVEVDAYCYKPKARKFNI